jgi:hypothetical protein
MLGLFDVNVIEADALSEVLIIYWSLNHVVIMSGWHVSVML